MDTWIAKNLWERKKKKGWTFKTSFVENCNHLFVPAWANKDITYLPKHLKSDTVSVLSGGCLFMSLYTWFTQEPSNLAKVTCQEFLFLSILKVKNNSFPLVTLHTRIHCLFLNFSAQFCRKHLNSLNALTNCFMSNNISDYKMTRNMRHPCQNKKGGAGNAVGILGKAKQNQNKTKKL